MTRLTLAGALIALGSLVTPGCGHAPPVARVAAPSAAALPWKGNVRVATAGYAAFDANTARRAPVQIVAALLSGIGVAAEVDCLAASAADGQQAVHAELRVSFAPATTDSQRREAIRLLRTLSPDASAYGAYLDQQLSLSPRLESGSVAAATTPLH